MYYSKFLLAVVVSGLFVLGITLLESGDVRFEAGLSSVERQQVAHSREALTRAESKTLLIMRDSTVRMVWYITSTEVSLRNVWGDEVRLNLSLTRHVYSVVRIVKPTDDEYPTIAMRFILQTP